MRTDTVPPPWSAPRLSTPRERAERCVVVVALHLLLGAAFLMQSTKPVPHTVAEPPPLMLRWIRPVPQVVPAAAVAPGVTATNGAPPAPRPRRADRAATIAVHPPAPETVLPPTAGSPDDPRPVTAPSALTPEASAQRPLALDSDATRAAVREAARQRSMQERHLEASEATSPMSPRERLSQAIARSGTGDCLKGEYAGGGMGLLSLPFWLAAEARGKCRR